MIYISRGFLLALHGDIRGIDQTLTGKNRSLSCTYRALVYKEQRNLFIA